LPAKGVPKIPTASSAQIIIKTSKIKLIPIIRYFSFFVVLNNCLILKLRVKIRTAIIIKSKKPPKPYWLRGL
jgi:hypothetical protein